ncbi:MAG: DNA repair protein RecN [Bacilli bacterium]
MLNNLKIKNFAIIDDMDISFDDGFSVIIGETGTGKSIIIEAINLILGSRSNKSMIRDGCEKSFLQANFKLSKLIKTYLDSEDIVCDEELEIIRILNANGKSSYKINGTLVTLATINKIRELIIDIKRQSDNEISNDEYFAIKLIDQYARLDEDREYFEYKELYKDYLILMEKIKTTKSSASDIDVEYVKMQLDRIDKLGSYEGEYEELKLKAKRASNVYEYNNVGKQLSEVLDKFYDLNVEISMLYKKFVKLGGEINSFDSIGLEVEDYVNSFSYSSDIIDEADIAEIESRIFEVKRIYDLYGGSYQLVNTAYEELNEQLYIYENSEHLLAKFDIELETLLNKINTVCTNINKKRQKVMTKICDDVANLLNEMYMEDAKIKFNLRYEDYNVYGNCNIDILIATNGNKFLPLDEIASGGEKARVILSLKKVIADKSDVSTIIFDEIDTGVSGRVAKAMGLIMKQISLRSQVIAITHLPQVAAISTNCLVVNKSKANEGIVSQIESVDGERKVRAIAQILSGETVTKEAMQNAKSLIDEGC